MFGELSAFGNPSRWSVTFSTDHEVFFQAVMEGNVRSFFFLKDLVADGKSMAFPRLEKALLYCG
jgi:hypothetical protein